MEDARRPPYDPHLVCFTYEERSTSGSGYGSKNALISGYYQQVTLQEWLIGTETLNGIMSNKLLEDNIELGKALLDICYMCIGGPWLNGDFLWFTW